jgi:tripartite-type tricarboxylate transporter receptor subunit TctC
MTKQKPSFASQWPTLAEQGMDVDAALWVGLFVPAGTPAAIVDRLDTETTRLLHDPEVRKRLNAAGTEPFPLSQAAFVQRIRTDAERYTKIIQQTGIRVQN